MAAVLNKAHELSKAAAAAWVAVAQRFVAVAVAVAGAPA